MLNFTHSFDITIFEIHLITCNILVKKKGYHSSYWYSLEIYFVGEILMENTIISITNCACVHKRHNGMLYCSHKIKNKLMWKFLFSFYTKTLSSVTLQIKCDFLWRDRTGILCYEIYRRTVSNLLRLGIIYLT